MQDAQDLCFGPYRLDLRTTWLWRDQESIKLTPKALSVLCLLVTRTDQVVTKDELFQAVWSDVVVGDDALTSCIQELRRALGDDARQPRYIETAHRRGYRFIGKVVSEQSSVGSQEESKNTKLAEGLRLKAERLPPSSLPSLSQLGSLDEAQRNAGKESESATRIALRSIRATELPFPTSTRIWAGRNLVWLAVVLLVGVSATALYLVSFRNLQSQIPNPEALPLPDKPSIAVMPFTNMSRDPEQEYFSDGLTDDLITALSRLSQLFVIARHSVFTYKGKAVKVQEVSRELGVQYVLEGSVQKTAVQVRINAQLVDATTGRHLWAERYDRPFKDIFALQDDIIQKIVTTLKLQFTLQEQGIVRPKRTDNLEAYDALLRGVEYHLRFTKEANAQARQLFERAIALDPAYADAYADLGTTYILEWMWKWSLDPQVLERAGELMQKAIALDDSLARAHGLLGFVYMQKHQYDQALAESERAVALAPNNAECYATQANVLLFAGRGEEALRSIEQAMRLNPHYPAIQLQILGAAYQATGRYAEAIATYKQLLVRNSNYLYAYVNLARAYIAQWAWQLSQDPQTLEQALTAAQRAVALNDSLARAHLSLGLVYMFQKHYEQALTELERAVTLDPNEAENHASLADALSRVGRPEEALRVVEQALRRQPLVVDSHLIGVGSAYVLVGRYEEAIIPLKRVLTSYPNMLGPHLNLAVAYSESGKEAEARTEAAEVLRLNPKFSLDVHKERTPIKDPATLERHIAALRKTGLK